MLYQASSPAALSYQADGGAKVSALAQRLAGTVHLPWNQSNALILQRGPYVVAAALQHDVSLPGKYVNLFDDKLAVHDGFTLPSGGRALLYQMKPTDQPTIVAAACRVRSQSWKNKVMQFQADGQSETEGVVRVASKLQPKEVLVAGRPLPQESLQSDAGTFLFRFENKAEPQPVEVRF